jgi:hypothetical protein
MQNILISNIQVQHDKNPTKNSINIEKKNKYKTGGKNRGYVINEIKY